MNPFLLFILQWINSRAGSIVDWQTGQGERKTLNSKSRDVELVTEITAPSLMWLVWFLCLMAYQLFLGYLMPFS